MGTSPVFVANYRHESVQFVPGISTRPRPLWVPGTAGSEITKINVASNDDAANKLVLGVARALTLGSQMGSGALVDNGTDPDTVTRSAGSFATDGWLAGNRIFISGSTTLANDLEDILTAVAAGTLSLQSGGGSINTAEGLPATAKLYRLSWAWYVDVASGAGLPSVVAVAGLDTTQYPSLDSSPDRLIKLGPNDILVGKLNTALTTGEIIDVTVEGGDY